jgi:hypothetical protein
VNRFIVRGIFRNNFGISAWEYGVVEDGLTIAVFRDETTASDYARWRNDSVA